MTLPVSLLHFTPSHSPEQADLPLPATFPAEDDDLHEESTPCGSLREAFTASSAMKSATTAEELEAAEEGEVVLLVEFVESTERFVPARPAEAAIEEEEKKATKKKKRKKEMMIKKCEDGDGDGGRYWRWR